MSICTGRNFGYADFQELLKKLFNTAGVLGKQVAFLFTENQILSERYLEDVNNILNSGEVPNLYTNEEFGKIFDDMLPVARNLGLPESRCVLVILDFFDRVLIIFFLLFIRHNVLVKNKRNRL